MLGPALSEHDAGLSQKKRSHRKKDMSAPREVHQPVRWSVEENYHLVCAWLEISEDPEASNFRSRGVFYTKVYETFVALLGKDQTYRHADKVSAHWRDINRKMQNFQEIYNRVRGSNWSLGKNDADIQRETLEQYQLANNGLSFNYLSCWEIIRNHPKWRENPTQLTTMRPVAANRTTKRSKPDSSSTPSTPTDTQNFNLVDDDDKVEVNLAANDDFVELARSPGRQSAKDKRGKGVGSSSSRAESVAVSVAESINRITDAIHHFYDLRQMEKALRLFQKRGKTAKAEAMAALLEKRYSEMYNMPPSP